MTTGEGMGPEAEAERDELLEQAHSLGDGGDFEGMAALLRDGLERFGDDPAVLCWLGVAERELGMEGVAYERFRRALACDPQDPFVLATAGNALASFDDPDAETALRAGAMLGRDVPLARWLYGAYLTREGMLDEGRVELEAARELDPDDATIRYELGVNLLFARRTAEAIDELGRACDLDPDDGWARSVLGLALLEDDRPDDAARELAFAASLRPDDVEVHLLAALALGAVGTEDDAWRFLEAGRMQAEGTDTLVADQVEERLEAGAASCARFLREHLGPVALHERMAARP